jgi:hypothetical protein
MADAAGIRKARCATLVGLRTPVVMDFPPKIHPAPRPSKELLDGGNLV